jgi:hypothetical protein
VDFGGYCFLPNSFAFALEYRGPSSLKRYIAGSIRYRRSSIVAAMVSASSAQAPFSSNDVGEQVSLLTFLFFASRPFTRILSPMYCTGLPREHRSRLSQSTRRTSRPPFSRYASDLLVTYVRTVSSRRFSRETLLCIFSPSLTQCIGSFISVMSSPFLVSKFS